MRIELNVQSAFLCVYFDKIPFGVPDKLKIWWGKGERNEVFIMNFKEIHSNTEFLSTYRRGDHWSPHIYQQFYFFISALASLILSTKSLPVSVIKS